ASLPQDLASALWLWVALPLLPQAIGSTPELPSSWSKPELPSSWSTIGFDGSLATAANRGSHSPVFRWPGSKGGQILVDRGKNSLQYHRSPAAPSPRERANLAIIYVGPQTAGKGKYTTGLSDKLWCVPGRLLLNALRVARRPTCDNALPVLENGGAEGGR